MSNVEISEGRDQKTGRFLAGNAGNGGRRPGQRNRLGEAFISDLADAWQKHGAMALEQCAIDEPGVFCKIIASLLPKQADLNIDVSVMHDASSVLEAFRIASDLLGVDPASGLRRLKRVAPLIQVDPT